MNTIGNLKLSLSTTAYENFFGEIATLIPLSLVDVFAIGTIATLVVSTKQQTQKVKKKIQKE